MIAGLQIAMLFMGFYALIKGRTYPTVAAKYVVQGRPARGGGDHSPSPHSSLRFGGNGDCLHRAEHRTGAIIGTPRRDGVSVLLTYYTWRSNLETYTVGHPANLRRRGKPSLLPTSFSLVLANYGT